MYYQRCLSLDTSLPKPETSKSYQNGQDTSNDCNNASYIVDIGVAARIYSVLSSISCCRGVVICHAHETHRINTGKFSLIGS